MSQKSQDILQIWNYLRVIKNYTEEEICYEQFRIWSAFWSGDLFIGESSNCKDTGTLNSDTKSRNT